MQLDKGIISLPMVSGAAPLKDGLNLKAQVTEYLKKPDARGFPLEAVSRKRALKTEICNHYVSLNASEFQKVMGQSWKQKLPKVPRIWVWNNQNQMEQVFVFRDEQRPWRSMALSTCIMEEQEQEIMQKECHLHERQGQELMSLSHSSHLDSSGLASLYAPNCPLSSIDEYLAKLHPGRGQEKKLEQSASTGLGDEEDEKGDAVEAEVPIKMELQEGDTPSHPTFKRLPSFLTPTSEEKKAAAAKLPQSWLPLRLSRCKPCPGLVP